MDTDISLNEDVGNGLRLLNSAHSSDQEETFTSHFQNNFKPLKILGQGGFGCVFEAEKHVLGKLTLWRGAVKRIPMKNSDNDVGKALKEVEALLKLNHEGIVEFYDAWAEQPPEGWQRSADNEMLEHLNSEETFIYRDDCAFLYIQMELCQSTLADWLAENQEYRDIHTVKDWFRQIVSAVAYIHGKNYIHRDLKPSNILFSGNIHPFRGEKVLKVCDLGIVTDRAISFEGNDREIREIPAERTFAKGTQMYMAPEQMGWADYTSKVDIFALGLILAEMLVVMDTEQAENVFGNYRNGRPNTILEHFPDAEAFVAWLTNPKDVERPESSELEYHRFTKWEPRQRGIQQGSSFIDKGEILVRELDKLEAKLIALTTKWTQKE